MQRKMFYVRVRRGAKRRRSILLMDAGATFLTVEPGGSAHPPVPVGQRQSACPRRKDRFHEVLEVSTICFVGLLHMG